VTAKAALTAHSPLSRLDCHEKREGTQSHRMGGFSLERRRKLRRDGENVSEVKREDKLSQKEGGSPTTFLRLRANLSPLEETSNERSRISSPYKQSAPKLAGGAV
jgi:hypothetical protein